MTHTTHSEPRPLVLPRLQRNEVQARNLLAQRARACAFELQGQPWCVTLEPWSPAAALSAAQPADWLILLDWAGAPFELRLPANACQRLMAASFDGLELPELPAAFAAAALESALQQVMALPAVVRRGAVQLVALQTQVTAGEPAVAAGRTLSHHFGLLLGPQGGDAAHSVYGSLSTDALGLMLMAGLVNALPAHTQEPDDALALRLRVEIGHTDLPLRELETLVVGDSVLLQDCWIDQEAGLWLGWDAVGFRAVWQQDQLCITHLLNTRGLVMPTDLDSAPVGDALHALQDVPVRLSFDLGERMLCLGELKALQVGQVLDLRRPLSQAVHVRVNGALIGTGELVDIDGQMGVTLLSLNGARAEGS